MFLIAVRDSTRYQPAMVYNHGIMAREKWESLPNVEIVTWSEEDQAKLRSVGHKIIYDQARASC